MFLVFNEIFKYLLQFYPLINIVILKDLIIIINYRKKKKNQNILIKLSSNKFYFLEIFF